MRRSQLNKDLESKAKCVSWGKLGLSWDENDKIDFSKPKGKSGK